MIMHFNYYYNHHYPFSITIINLIIVIFLSQISASLSQPPYARVWHTSPWQVKGSLDTKRLHASERSPTTPAEEDLSGTTRVFFRTTSGVRQGCLLSPGLFRILLEKIVQETSASYIPSGYAGAYVGALYSHSGTAQGI